MIKVVYAVLSLVEVGYLIWVFLEWDSQRVETESKLGLGAMVSICVFLALLGYICK